MAEEKKEKILKFLKEFPKQEFSITQLKEMVGFAYPTVLKWVLVLEAERRVRIKDYGNVKLVYLNEEYNPNDNGK